MIYVNIGIQESGALAPPNMSHNVVPAFELTSPTNEQYPGSWCIPQIGMPANVSLQVGQNITLQVVELAQHGAALYSCVDLTLVEDGSPLVAAVDGSNCINSTETIGFQLVFTTEALASAGFRLMRAPAGFFALVTVAALSLIFVFL
ncbi:hypothetical protein LTR53_014254 [Teratosphaeriaceae sp. CCFEE 6253]|nr:hypothetical protein LTR53_014254 [Teratosphaeriaceae sp. CCFEE 6253]